jgi:hypothetical protein
MKGKLAVALICLTPLAASLACSGGDGRSLDLSSGFRVTDPGGERILSHDKTPLGPVGVYFVSPSGRYALYESNGRHLLYDTEYRKSTDFTPPAPYTAPRSVVWDEPLSRAVVTYMDERPQRTFLLP